jgi:hypothetical protein
MEIEVKSKAMQLPEQKNTVQRSQNRKLVKGEMMTDNDAILICLQNFLFILSIIF